uniref:Uncharacterized protein n=1 Tax=Megaselia scalaris TaxID=36166 RepID=T1GHB4_MEGSC
MKSLDNIHFPFDPFLNQLLILLNIAYKILVSILCESPLFPGKVQAGSNNSHCENCEKFFETMISNRI